MLWDLNTFEYLFIAGYDNKKCSLEIDVRCLQQGAASVLIAAPHVFEQVHDITS